MTTIQVKGYAFPELSDKAKENVKVWLSPSDFEFEEVIPAINQFADEIGITILDYSISFACASRSIVKYRGTPHTRFIKNLDTEWHPVLAREWNKTRNVQYAFDKLFKAVEESYEYYISDEAITETCEANNYIFNKNGEPIHHLAI